MAKPIREDLVAVLMSEEEEPRGDSLDEGGEREPAPEEQAGRLKAKLGSLVAGHGGGLYGAAAFVTFVYLELKTLRVDLSKLDRLLTLVGEIAVSRGQAMQLLSNDDVDLEVLRDTQLQAEWLHDEVQEVVMQLRMVPVGPVLRQYARTVRDLAVGLGRKAELHVVGGDVELDNSVLRMLRDPLRHMVRNAVDHGIESVEDRKAAGKPEIGQVTLAARRAGSGLVFELHDDGRGIDREKVLAKARNLGLVGPDEEPSSQALNRHLFSAGFSTARSVTDVSGRGVGMDVVRRNIESLRGTVTVDSELGKGTTFRIELPLTLAIIDGLGIRVGATEYVVPLEDVLESMEVADSTMAPGRRRRVAR